MSKDIWSNFCQVLPVPGGGDGGDSGGGGGEDEAAGAIDVPNTTSTSSGLSVK